jgi:hypothetical protein
MKPKTSVRCVACGGLVVQERNQNKCLICGDSMSIRSGAYELPVSQRQFAMLMSILRDQNVILMGISDAMKQAASYWRPPGSVGAFEEDDESPETTGEDAHTDDNVPAAPTPIDAEGSPKGKRDPGSKKGSTSRK